jgi:hypothetical protein
MVEKVCPECGNTFTASRSSQIYCSHSCRNKVHCKRAREVAKERGDEWYLKDKARRRIKIPGLCRDCGRPTDYYRCTTCEDKHREQNRSYRDRRGINLK